MSVKCWASIAGAGQYTSSPSQYFMLGGSACIFSVVCCCRQWNASICLFHKCAYTVFWKGCDRHCCRQRDGSICLFHKCAYTVSRKWNIPSLGRAVTGKRAQWCQRKGSIYVIYKWAHTAFWQHCYTQDRNEWYRHTDRTHWADTGKPVCHPPL